MPELEPEHVRTAEEHDTVRRRVGPFAIAALALAIAGLVMLLRTLISEGTPPSILGVNLSFSAMLMGVGIAIYAKPTPGTKFAVITGVLAVLIGAAGPFVYFKQGFDWRIKAERRELANLAAISKAARQYALDNGGVFPASMQVLIEQKRIDEATRYSPYLSEERAKLERAVQKGEKPLAELEAWRQTGTDYVYFAPDLKLDLAKQNEWPGNIIIVTRNEPIMRTNLPMAFLDGTADMYKLDDVEKRLAESNASRAKMGLEPSRPPASVERAATQNGR